jgi:hypothetical protein
MLRAGKPRNEDYFPIEQRHHTFQVFDLLIGDGVEVAIPHGDVGSFAYLKPASNRTNPMTKRQN